MARGISGRQIRDDDFVSEDELRAGWKDIVITEEHDIPNPFPLSISSISDKTIIVSTAALKSWQAQAGDTVEIVGGASAGDYTIDEVLSNTELIVLEDIPSSTGEGVLTIYHPPAATHVGVDSRELDVIQGETLQDVLEASDAALQARPTFDQHRDVRQLIHFIDHGPSSNSYKETLPEANPFPTSIIWYETSEKTKKIVSLTITRGENQLPMSIVWEMYDIDGSTLIATITDTITYNGPFEVSRTRSIT